MREVDDFHEVAVLQHTDEHHRPEERVDDRAGANGGDQVERQPLEVTEGNDGCSDWSGDDVVL